MHLLRFAVVTLVALLAPTVSCVPPEDSAEVPQFPTIAYAAQQLDVRELPEVTAQILARLPQGSAVSVGTCASGWCGIATSEVEGYGEQAYLTDSLPPTQTTAEQQRPQGRGYWNANGEWVQSPTWTADGSPPLGATAQCRDGSYSFSNTRRGTCSWHGGVARWLPRADSIRR